MMHDDEVKSVLNKTQYELNPSDSVIPDVTHKLINCMLDTGCIHTL